MDELVESAGSGDRFFTSLSSGVLYAIQAAPHNRTWSILEEEDAKNQFIVAMNDELIQDNVLRERLVAPLPTGSSLVAVFDSCHNTPFLRGFNSFFLVSDLVLPSQYAPSFTFSPNALLPFSFVSNRLLPPSFVSDMLLLSCFALNTLFLLRSQSTPNSFLLRSHLASFFLL
ncbi:hypothetical protein K443DRAFT_5246 [Laccaria amethystina LaAM-08-1]|uniref:Uncharacterized protein n=1 Tax=Laccaria amethystina LaAM-08-1 TaxID=1095629 RepID=A0A0C9XPU8_9AGAR|nr:hypothetical protein K443DRAFT_5246 [Laccaria amethystina LaAM-08-1]